ncbi:MAG: hypothetical protein PUB86_00095 [Elusimicrobia bacterium]|nr:hypothetical protein [Elusimicrobiota bacterium]
MTNNVPKCTSASSVNCYEKYNSSESLSPNCDSSQRPASEASGGNTSILTMRYNHGLPSGTINCYFEGLRYRTCID